MILCKNFFFKWKGFDWSLSSLDFYYYEFMFGFWSFYKRLDLNVAWRRDNNPDYLKFSYSFYLNTNESYPNMFLSFFNKKIFKFNL